MADFASRILSQLGASTNRSATAQSLLTSFGAGADGALSQAEFQRVFAEIELQRSTAPTSSIQPTTFSARKTVFECMLYPSFRNNYSVAKSQASEMLAALDANKDGSVTLNELQSYDPNADTSKPTTDPTATTPAQTTDTSSSTSSDSTASGTSTDPVSNSPVTPAPTFIAMALTTVGSIANTSAAASFATMMLQAFDTAGKGYFTADDVQAACEADPALGDPSHAHSIVSQLDGNGDGEVTQQEAVIGYQQLDLASNLLGAFDPTGAGYIDLNQLMSKMAPISPSFAELMKSWDGDGDGQLNSADLLSGIKASSMPLSEMSSLANVVNSAMNAQRLMSQYDSSNKGFITAADLTAAWANAQTPGDAAIAQNTLTGWDVNSDGQVNLGELINGQQVGDVANQLLAQFDPAMLGYIDLSSADGAAMSAAPKLVNLLKSWDVDGNAQLTQGEIVNGLQASNLKYQLQSKAPDASGSQDAAGQALSIMSQMDINYDGQINLSEFVNFASANASISADPISTFNAWDTNNDGYLTLDEVQTGIQTIQQAQSILSQYDTAGKGYFDANDLEAALTTNDPTQAQSDAAAQAQQIMNFWDADGDGKVTVQEVIQGIKGGGYVGGVQLGA